MVRETVNLSLTVPKLSDQSRQNLLIVCCNFDVILEMESGVNIMCGRTIDLEKLGAWLIAWEELGTVHFKGFFVVLIYSYNTVLEVYRADFDSSYHLLLD